MPKIKRALISVFDKTGIVDFAHVLEGYGVEIISTGGTAKQLQENGIRIRMISEITGFPEILDGRVKTLHPKIYGGLLALRDRPAHIKEIETHGIELLDLVVVNLYPFQETIAKKDVSISEALENIDIGGPGMIRAAAKNYLHVAVVTSPDQYAEVMAEIQQNNGHVTSEKSKKLAAEAFRRTAAYDSAIHTFLARDESPESVFPDNLTMQYEKVQDLRYGENPHQRAAFYRERAQIEHGLLKIEQLHGKELSFNNMLDLDAALGLVQEFEEPCTVIVKHTNPCGIAIGANGLTAYLNAKATDPVSAFGGIVGSNRVIDVAAAKAIHEVFTEAVIAPGFEPEALQLLKSKKNVRLLKCAECTRKQEAGWDFKRVQGGLLLQDQDLFNLRDIKLEVVSKRVPTDDEWTAMKFGWRVAKWVKSNAIVFTAKDHTLGIGAGQMSRVDSSKFAIAKAHFHGLSLAGSALASDAFFPFRDAVDVAAEAGATAIIQPGGSIRDQEVIAAADEQNMAMVFTGVRHFRH